jgi:hypothetical protein
MNKAIDNHMAESKTQNSRISRLIAFWDEDRSLSVMFVLLLLFIFVFVPVMEKGKIGQFALRIVYSVMLFTAILSVSRQRKYLNYFVAFAMCCLLMNWLVDYVPSKALYIAGDISTIIFNLFFALAILNKTFSPGEITYRRIEGSIVVFLLAGLILAYVFHAIYTFAGPESFNNISGTGLKEFFYFSFTSLTTMGYGDISPVHPLARSLANFEGLFGQLFPAILITRLVSMEFESSVKRKQNE